jgi:hypothetical protein
VKSVKTVTGIKETEREIFGGSPLHHPTRIQIEGKVTEGTYRMRQFETETEPKYEFILPEDQQRVVEMIKELASKRGLKVEVVDVTKENVLHRKIQEEFERIRTFPTLMLISGEKIEGNMTRNQIESIMSSEVPKKNYF